MIHDHDRVTHDRTCPRPAGRHRAIHRLDDDRVVEYLCCDEGGATVRVHHTGNAECAACPGLRDCAHIRAVTEHLRVGTPPRSDDERQDRDHEDDA